MGKTLAQLKKDAKTGTVFAKMVIRCGGTNVPENMQRLRPIVDANSVAIFFQNPDGKKSEMRIKRASLVDYTDDLLTIYTPGTRELNSEETAVINEWKAIEATPDFQRRSEIDALSDGSSTYYQEKFFFEKKGMKYLFGFEEEGGMKYNRATQKVVDCSIRGSIEMQYELYKKEG